MREYSVDPLTYEQMEQWLESKGKDEIVGYVRNTTCCPLATCVKELGLFENPVACDVYVRENHKRVFMKCQNWAMNFVKKIDIFGVDGAAVTAGAALIILHSVKENGYDRVS